VCCVCWPCMCYKVYVYTDRMPECYLVYKDAKLGSSPLICQSLINEVNVSINKLTFKRTLKFITFNLLLTVSSSTSHLFARHSLHLLDDLCLLVGGVQVGHVARVENHADVLHESLVLDLTVSEQEHRVLPFTARLQQQLDVTYTHAQLPYTAAIIIADMSP